MKLSAAVGLVYWRYHCWRCHRKWLFSFDAHSRLMNFWEDAVADPERPHYSVAAHDLLCPAPGCGAQLWHGRAVAQTADGDWIRVPRQDWNVS